MSGLFVVVAIKQRPFGRSKSGHFQKPLRHEHNKTYKYKRSPYVGLTTHRRTLISAGSLQVICQPRCGSSQMFYPRVTAISDLWHHGLAQNDWLLGCSGWFQLGVAGSSLLFLPTATTSFFFCFILSNNKSHLSSSVQTEKAPLEEEAG